MGKCEYLIAQAITENCDDPLVKGLEKRGIIINRDDVDFGAVEFAADKSNVVSALPLLSGKKAFEIYQPGNTPFTGSNSALATGTSRNTFTHQIVMYIPDSGPDVAESIIDPLANGSFLVILENKFKKMQGTPAGAAAFEIYGFYQGLVANAATLDKYSDDTNGGWSFTLQEAGSPKSALYLFAETYAATKTVIETLLKGATE